jgi:hypothetical protein
MSDGGTLSPVTTDIVERHLDFAHSGIEEEIARKQVEGVAGLWHILSNHRYAYLADEVGMGKTYQALGVIALTWMLQPEARVLVIAPNKSVQSNWAREYRSFCENNVIRCGGRVNDLLTGKPTREVLVHQNLGDFTEALLHKRPGLHLARLSAFSHLSGSLGFKDAPTPEAPLTYADVSEHLRRKQLFVSAPAGREELELTNSIQLNVACAIMLGELLPMFDLVVIDEAHLLRNRGDNIMTNVFAHMLGMRPPAAKAPIAPLADKDIRPPMTLLLSATPAHRSEQDIYNQLAYLDADASTFSVADGKHRQAFLNERFVRRLRLFCGKSKYDYRADLFQKARAIRAPGSSEQRPSLTEELFFIASQKAIEESLCKDKLTASVKLGFLECFESYELEDVADETEGSHYEVSEKYAPDRAALEELVLEYQACTKGVPPPHPKMGLIEDDYREQLASLAPEKLLIFVRRRASVHEITRRVCAIYDQNALAYLGEALGEEFEHVSDFRSRANAILGRGGLEPCDNSEDERGESIRSRVLELFASRVKDAEATNRFRDRFRQSGSLREALEENLLRLLHRAHHEDGLLGYASFLEENISAQLRAELRAELSRKYFWNSTSLHVGRATAHVHRRVLSSLKRHERYGALSKKLCKLLADDPSPPHDYLDGEVTIEREETLDLLLERTSLWDVILDEWCESDLAEQAQVFQALRVTNTSKLTALRTRTFVRNVFDKNLRIGEGVLDLFVAYARVSANVTGNDRLDRSVLAGAIARVLSDGMREDSERRSTLWRMAEFVRMEQHMKPLFGSVLDRRQRLWAETNWSVLDQQEPILGVMGGSSSRERAIIQFNTPFFPDIVVCTDIFREGVNLHRCCRRVWHYGMSATPGDIEQRTGRVDRYFSVVHRALLESEQTSTSRGMLDVGFPYLGQSIDEDQLAQAISRRLEVQPLLDKGTADIDVSDELELDAPTGSLESLTARLQKLEGASAEPFPPVFPSGVSTNAFAHVSSARSKDAFVGKLVAVLGHIGITAIDISEKSTTIAQCQISPSELNSKGGVVRVTLRPTTGPMTHALGFETPLPEGLSIEEGNARLSNMFPDAMVAIEDSPLSNDAWSKVLYSTTPIDLDELDFGEAPGVRLTNRIGGDLEMLLRVAVGISTVEAATAASEMVWELDPTGVTIDSDRLYEILLAGFDRFSCKLSVDLQGRGQTLGIARIEYDPRQPYTHIVRSIVAMVSECDFESLAPDIVLPTGSVLRRMDHPSGSFYVLQGRFHIGWSREHVISMLEQLASVADLIEWHVGRGEDVY